MGDLISLPIKHVQPTLAALDEVGVTTLEWTALRRVPGLVRRLKAFLISGGVDEPFDHRSARMFFTTPGEFGIRFFGIAERILYLGHDLDDEFARKAPRFPWSIEVLESPCPFYPKYKVRETHFAFLGWSIPDGSPYTLASWVWSNREIKRWFLTSPESWPGEPAVHNVNLQPHWYLFPIYTLNEPMFFEGKNYAEQIATLPSEYEVALAVEKAVQMSLFRVLRDRPPFGERYIVRDRSTDGQLLGVGDMGHGIYLGYAEENEGKRFGWPRLAVSRKASR